VPRLLLLVPTETYRAAAFLEAAERLRVEVVIGSERRQAMAETMGDRFVLVPLRRPSEGADAVVRYAQRRPLDAVMAIDDQGSLTAAIAAERLGLRHSPPGAVAATRDKSAMRELLRRAGVPQPEFRVAGGAYPTPSEAGARLGFPVVLKPRTLAASRGVIRADDASSAAAAYERIRGILAAAGDLDTATILVEELVPGPEVAVEGLVRAGALEVLAVFDKPDQGDGPYFEETIYVTPSRLPAATVDAVAAVTAAAVAAIGISQGPVHAELRVPEGREPQVLEVAARTIGGRCSQALTFATGATLEELVIAHALGLPAGGTAPGAPAAGVMMLPIPASGVLAGVDGVDSALAVEGVRGIDITAHPGQLIEQLPEGSRYLGFLFATGDTPAAVERALRTAHAALRITITPAGA
jgi:biotin carboxylase